MHGDGSFKIQLFYINCGEVVLLRKSSIWLNIRRFFCTFYISPDTVPFAHITDYLSLMAHLIVFYSLHSYMFCKNI